jgi:putative MATE family efflux protein
MQDLTSGSVARHLVKTAGFMLVTMMFQTLYFLVDLYWVGRLGKEAVAGVGIAGNLTFIVIAITQMLGVGVTTLVSHAVGRKDRAGAQLAFDQAMGLSVVVGLIFLIVAMGLRTPYVNLLGPDARTASQAGEYLLWFIPAMALQLPMACIGAALRGTGNFRPGMVVQTATVILNIALAPFLIFGWIGHRPLGVAGAAIASLLAVVVGNVWLSMFLRPETSYLKLVPADWKPSIGIWRRMLAIGLPAGGEFDLMGVYVFVVYIIARPFGAAAQAGFGIGMRITQAAFMPVVALAFSVAPVAGQNFGARQPGRVRATFKTAVAMAATFMLLVTLLCQIAGQPVVGAFTDDPQVIGMGAEYLWITSWNLAAAGIVFVASSMFQAMGNTLPPLAASFARIVAVAIPAFALARVPGFELRWIWYLSVVAGAMQLVVIMLLLRREFRRRLDFAYTPAIASVPSRA